jgi:hypothetical protein
MDPISIATSAFAAIKSGISVGKELHSLSGQIIKFVKQMNVVEEEHKKEREQFLMYCAYAALAISLIGLITLLLMNTSLFKN